MLDPTTLRYVVVLHLEGDESGALNHFLERAPHARAVGSPIGAAVNLSDFAIRDPLAVDDSDTFDLGSHRLRFLVRPYVYQWDSMLAYDETTRTVLCSDVFISLGEGPAVTDRDESDAHRTIGISPSKRHLESALDKIEATEPATLACHHGSVKGGRGVALPARDARERRDRADGVEPDGRGGLGPGASCRSFGRASTDPGPASPAVAMLCGSCPARQALASARGAETASGGPTKSSPPTRAAAFRAWAS